MFGFIKKKKSAKEFQAKYNLTEAEMSQIRFVKVKNFSFVKGPKTEYIAQQTTENFDLYKKINPLTPILEEKLKKAKSKFFDLTSMFNKEKIFDRVKETCYEDLTDFLYRFSFNSKGIRISYAPTTPVEVMQQVWDKADLFLDAICAYYLLQLDGELVDYTPMEICAIIKFLLQKNKIEFNQNYEEIRSYVIERAKSEGLKTTAKYLSNDWSQASIVKG